MIDIAVYLIFGGCFLIFLAVIEKGLEIVEG